MSEAKTIVIQGVQVQVAQPYAEGHTVTAAEAKALNQVRAENIRNNCAKQIAAIKGDAEELTAEQLSEISTLVSEYDAGYEFTLASVGGGGRTTDPIEKEAKSIARQLVADALRKQGRKVKDVDAEQLAAKVAEVAEMPEVQKLAKERVKNKQKLAEATSAALSM